MTAVATRSKPDTALRRCRRRRAGGRGRRGGRPTPSASTSVPRPSPTSSGSSPTGSPRWPRATAAGSGRSRCPGSLAASRSPSTRSSSSRARARCSRRRGCRGPSGCSPATSARATCCPPTPDDTAPGAWLHGSRPTTSPRSLDVVLRARSRPAHACCPPRAATTPPTAGSTAPADRTSSSPSRRPAACETCGFLVRLGGGLGSGVRRLRQRVVPERRARREPRPRLRRALRGCCGRDPRRVRSPRRRPRRRRDRLRRPRPQLTRFSLTCGG